MAKGKDIVISLILDGKQFNATIQNSDKLARQLKGSVTGVGDTMAKWSMMITGFNQGLQVVSKIGSFFGGALDAYKQSEQAQMKVQTAVKSTGMAAGFTATQLNDMASELQKITTFDDDQILNEVTAQLLTFTNVTGEQFKRAQVAAMDLSTVLDGDLKSASIMLGKALNDPIQGLTAMRRVGIAFTEEQQKTIKGLVDENKLMEAQTLILDELGKQYGGQAEARAKTRTGEIQQAENELGDAVEKIGGLTALVAAPLMKTFASATTAIVDLILPTEKLSEKLMDQQIEFNALMNIMQDDTIERETKKLVMDQLNNNYKEYLGNLDLEKASIEDIAKAQMEANIQFDKKIKLQAGQETYAEFMKELADKEKKIMQAQVEVEKLKQDFNIGAIEGFNKEGFKLSEKDKAMFDFAAMPYLGSIEDWRNDLSEKKAEFKSFMEFLDKQGIDIATKTTGGKIPGGGGGGGDKKKKDEFDPFAFDKGDLAEERGAMYESDAEKEKMYLNEIERINDLTIAKDEYFNSEMEKEYTESYEKEALRLKFNDLENNLLLEEMNRADLMRQMQLAETQQEFKALQDKKKITDEKIKIIKAEKDARERAAFSMIESGMAQYNVEESLGKQMNRLVNESIKRIISEAVATQIAKVIAMVPWPFNLVVAPAAGLALQALMEQLIPSFATGVTNFKGGMALVGERGPELVNLPSGSDVIPNRETRNVLFGSDNQMDGFRLIASEIRNQTERLELVERIINLDPNRFDEAYNRFQDQKLKTG